MKALKRIISKKVLRSKFNSVALSQEELTKKQRAQFEKLKANLNGTTLSNHFQLEECENYDVFAKRFPVRDYSSFKPYVDSLIDDHKKVMFHSRPLYFGLTSGTSGKDSKKIPYNKEMIDLFLSAQQLLAGVVQQHLPESDLVNSDRLTYGSNPSTYEEKGIKYGYISGILSSKTPWALKKTTFPSNEVLAIENWDQKMEALALEVLARDIRIISGIPSYLITIFEYILKREGKSHLIDIWPNLETVIYGATPIDQYKEKINALAGKKLNYFGIYASTETPIGIAINNAKDEKQVYAFHPEVLYTFTDVTRRDRTYGIDEVEVGKEYFVNTSTPNGFVNYTMKDIVRIKEVSPVMTFEIIGREGSGINLAAEKTSDEQVLDTIIALNDELTINLDHYFLCPGTRNERPCYQWTIFSDSLNQDHTEKLEELVDRILCEKNLDYGDCREDDILERPVVKIISSHYLKEYFNANKERGQFKMKTVFSCPDAFNGFVQSSFPELQLTLGAL